MNTEQKDMKYKHNHISNVIFRVDFPKILALELKEYTADFQKEIIKKFPIVKEISLDNLHFQIKDKDLSTEKSEEFAWEFIDRENNKKVFVSSEFVYVEYLAYLNFEEFYKDIELVFNTLIELYPVEIATRVGLRYINQIELKEGSAFDWDNLIHPSLYKFNNEFFSEEDKLARSMHLFEINEDNNILKFQFGLFNSEYPNKISKREFVLDYDCTTSNIEINDVFNTINQHHLIIKKWFEKSILNGLREELVVLQGGIK